MKIIIFFLLFPLLLYPQSNEKWLTSFATVEFKDDIVIYKYCSENPVCALEPEFLFTDHIKLVPYAVMMTGCKEIHEGIKNLHQYLLNPENPKNDKSDILRYIKAFTLQTILALRGEEIPSKELFGKIEQLAINPDKEIANHAEQLINIYFLIEKTLTKYHGYLDYLYKTETTGFVPEMFSSERIIAPNNTNENKRSLDSITWPKYYGEPNRNDYSRDIMETYDKGYLICGGYNDFAWLIKTDINGNILWEKILECDGFNYLNAIHQTMEGGILVCGAIQHNKDDQVPYALKLNACGEKEWCTIFAGSTQSNPWAQDIKETSSGDIVVLVNQYGENNVEDMDLFKLDTNGNLLWRKTICSGSTYTESALPIGESLLITINNYYLISGNVYWEEPWNPGGNKVIRPLFVMVDTSGTEKWILPFGLQDTLYGDAFEAIEISSGLFVGIGSEWPDSGKNGLAIAFNEIGIVEDFNIIDFSTIDQQYQDGILLNIQKYDTLFVTGCGLGELNQGLKGGEIVFGENILDSNFIAYFHRYDSNASYPYSLGKANLNKILSNYTFKETGNWDIVLSKLNLNLEYDTAYPGNYTYDSLCTTPGQPQSGFIYLDDCDIITGIDIPSPEEYYAQMQTIPLTVYPNPVNDRVNFAMENTEHHNNITLKCYNLLGKQVFETLVITGQKETSTLVSTWPQGMYVAVVYSDGLPVGQCKFVVR